MARAAVALSGRDSGWRDRARVRRAGDARGGREARRVITGWSEDLPARTVQAAHAAADAAAVERVVMQLVALLSEPARLREARDRVRAAILNSGFDFPPRRIFILDAIP